MGYYKRLATAKQERADRNAQRELRRLSESKTEGLGIVMGMFANAAAAPAPEKPKKSAKAKPTIEGAKKLAMIDAFEKALEALRAQYEGEVKGAARKHFATLIAATGTRPESFKGIEGGAAVTLTLAKKSVAHALSDEAVALLRAHGLEPFKEIVTPELYAINPNYASDQGLLARVEAALAGIVPENFIIVQPEASKLVCDEGVFNAALAKLKGAEEEHAEVLTVVSSVTAKPKLEKVNMAEILEFVRDELMIDDARFGDAAAEARAKPKLSLVA